MNAGGESYRFRLCPVMLETVFSPIPSGLGFIFSVGKKIDYRIISGYVIRELGVQDPILNHKKIINHLDYDSRNLFIGPALTVHMNHTERVLRRFPTFRHGLTRDHVRRDRDRQNCKLAQGLTFTKVQDCRGEIITGAGATTSPLPTAPPTHL